MKLLTLNSHSLLEEDYLKKTQKTFSVFCVFSLFLF